jgi:hypothetical protein
MEKSLLVKLTLVAGAAASLFALTLLVGADRRPPQAFGRFLMWLGFVVLSVSLMLFWSTIVGFLSQARMWSPQWTFLAGAVPFYILAIWLFFFGSLEMRILGYTRMLLMVCFSSASGQRARKRAYPQLSDKDPPTSQLPPPTLFPK